MANILNTTSPFYIWGDSNEDYFLSHRNFKDIDVPLPFSKWGIEDGSYNLHELLESLNTCSNQLHLSISYRYGDVFINNLLVLLDKLNYRVTGFSTKEGDSIFFLTKDKNT